MHAGKAKSPGELINWLTMTLPRAPRLTEHLKGTVPCNVQQIRPGKTAVSGRQTAGGKENNVSAILAVHEICNTTCAIKVGYASAQKPSLNVGGKSRLRTAVTAQRLIVYTWYMAVRGCAHTPSTFIAAYSHSGAFPPFSFARLNRWE